MSDLVRHSVTQPRTGVVTYTPSILVGDRPFVAGPAAQNLTGALFQKAPTFFTGAVTPGAVTLSGALFQKAPTFFAGQITQPAGGQTLDGTLFQKAGTFPIGNVSSISNAPETLRVLVSAQRW